jgi:hypothetical protein
MVEHRPVAPDVAGSIPVIHPKLSLQTIRHFSPGTHRHHQALACSLIHIARSAADTQSTN